MRLFVAVLRLFAFVSLVMSFGVVRENLEGAMHTILLAIFFMITANGYAGDRVTPPVT
jgi:hypothetical protein